MSSLRPIRLLYVPNEEGDFRQVGIRRPLSDLSAAGLISELSIYSLQWRQKTSGQDPEDSRQGLLQRFRDFGPTHVFLQHMGATGLRDRHMRDFAESSATVIYHEADPYSRWIHPLPHAARAVGRAADVVFTVGKGVFADNFSRTGTRDVRWSRHVYETDRYPLRPVGGDTREFDVVMIANRNRPRVRGLPDWRNRIRFVELMSEALGERFAIFGNGWEGPSARGPVVFDRQADTIRAAWISANWDHYAAEPWYFSNRLPISLSAGSIHATSRHPGYDEVFRDCDDFLICEDSPSTLVGRIQQYLADTSVPQRMAAARRAQDFVDDPVWRQDAQLVEMLNAVGEVIDPDAAEASWGTADEMTEEM